MRIMQEMSLMEKLNILSDAAKYDVACTSSGSNRRGDGKGIGNTVNAGICHSFSADGRCISLLKILFTNECIYDCKYCQNRRSNDVPRTSFTPDEVCRLTIEFYRRNYIEGLFLSSGIIQNPNVTMGLLYQTIYKLRTQYHFQGYIHVKAIPELILRNLVQSQVRNVVGSSTVDSVLTTGKENIQMQVKNLVSEILTQYDIGLALVDVKIQDAEPPTQEVIEAFKNVETAKQQAETVINDAKAYENAQLPKAQAEADKLIQNAQYLKEKRINEATEQVAMFNAMYQEYALNPEVTKTRMYYEAISDILPGIKLYINTGTGSDMQMLLPLETLVGSEGGETQ